MNGLRKAGIWVLFGTAAGALVAVIIAREPSEHVGGDSDWGDFFRLEDLISQSDIVLMGVLVGERKEEVRIPSDYTDEVFVRQDLIRTYEVTRVIAGDYIEDSIEVRGGVSYDFENPATSTRRGQKLPGLALKTGEEYVLFLRWYESDTSPSGWGQPGEPGTAVLDEGNLLFITTERHKQSMAEASVVLPVEGSGAPFAATISEVQGIHSATRATPATLAPD